MRGEVDPNKNAPVVPKPRPGRGYLLKRFSRISDAFSRIRGIPEVLTSSKGSKSTPKSYQATRPWQREANRATSQDSDRDTILPLHNMQNASFNEEVPKTFDLHVDTREADSSLAVNELGQE